MSKFKGRSVLLKKLVLDLAEAMRTEGLGCNAKVYREYGVSHSTFYKWKKAYLASGIAGLERQKPIAKSHPRQLSPEVIEKILHLRKKYHFGPQQSPDIHINSGPVCTNTCRITKSHRICCIAIRLV